MKREPLRVFFIICGGRLLGVSPYWAALELVFMALRFYVELLATRKGSLIMERVAFCRCTAP